MSPVKRAARQPQATLVIMAGARHVEGGVLDARAQWRNDSVFRIAVEAADGGAPDLEALCLALARMPTLPDCAKVRVVVADCWLASAGMPWSAEVQAGKGMDALSRTRLAAAGHAVGAGDIIRRDDAAFGAPRLVLAYPAALLDALALVAARVHGRLDSVLALSAAAWSLAQEQAGAPGALVLADEGLILIAHGTRGRPVELTLRRAAGAVAPDALALWQRQCLRDPQLAALDQVQWLDLSGEAGPVPGQPFAALAPAGGSDAQGGVRLRFAARANPRRDAFDAIQPAASARQLTALALAILLTAGAGLYAWQGARTVSSLEADLTAPPASKPSAAVPVSWSPGEKLRVPAVNTAIRELNLPFAAILRALEPPPDLRVAVLSVTTAASTTGAQQSRVKIVAEARTAAEMARYVGFVAERKPFTGAFLSEHEIDEKTLERPYRFTLEATWKD